MSTLRDQMLGDLQLKGITPRTQKTYLREVRNFAKHFGKSPEELGENEVRKYLLYLLNERKLSEGTLRFYLAALKFLYKTTLKRNWIVEKIQTPRRKKKLPVVAIMPSNPHRPHSGLVLHASILNSSED